MRVMVLGSGVIGTASAYYLARAGFEVVVVDRQPAAAMETIIVVQVQLSMVAKTRPRYSSVTCRSN